MKIVIPTIGSRGDVQPFIALGQGLLRAGFGVTLASHPLMRSLVESHGVPFAPIGPDIDLAEEVAEIRGGARSPALGLIRGMRFGFDMLERSHEDILNLCRNADLVVVPTAIAAGKNEAELLEKPYLSVTLMPWAIPWDDPERPFVKRVAYRLIDSLVHTLTTRPLNQIRKRLGLPPVGEEGFTSVRLNLVPVSPAVYAPNPRWESQHRVTGYWFVDPPCGWVPPGDLLSFLDAGEPPLLINLGAMSLGERDVAHTVRLFVDAVQQVGVRAIIQGWEDGIQNLVLPPTVLSCGSVPHSWMLPRCAAIVHHGGYGTTAAGFRAGLPALVIPHIADQFYWAQKVAELGVGPQPIPRSRLSPDRLVSAFGELVSNEEMRIQASVLGTQIRSEDGIVQAVNLIVETFTELAAGN